VAAIPIPYVVDRSGVIRVAYVDANYAARLEPAAILRSLREIAASQ
jgi:hypothetical protein